MPGEHTILPAMNNHQIPFHFQSAILLGRKRRDLGAADQAGAVSTIYGSATGFTAIGDQFWH